ncbi:POT family domain-containing protein [Ditylenchus destructor]|nr:POT family domain-containing protein [Ditylenchus destructor]
MGLQNHDDMLHPIDEKLDNMSPSKLTAMQREKPKMAVTWPEMIRAWPKTTLCIVSNEFCERFSFYGMRTILLLYFLNVLKADYDTAIVGANGFTGNKLRLITFNYISDILVLCYLTPLLGSIIADGYIGKFRTIFILSIVYAFGQIWLALASTLRPGSPFHPYVDIAGLVIIALGTGGIKPCVASFGGDQFEPHQDKMLSLFFSVFYFSINAGSMISTFVSPIFRAQSCLDQDSCYPLAFGVPAILMVVATVFFIAGSPWYKKPPPKENVFGEVYRAVKKAFVNKSRGTSRKRDHWLDYYMDTHVCERDPKCMELQQKKRDKSLCQKVPMFWALYDQQGSSWTIQAVQMKCRFSSIFGDIMLLPDQMQTLNAVLILAFIPIFQTVVYPLAGMCVKLTPLRKMIAGGLLATLAFVVSSALQFQVNTTLPDFPSDGNGFVSIMNGFDKCNITVAVKGNTNILPVNLSANMTLVNDNTKSDPKERKQMFELPAGDTTWSISYNGFDCNVTQLNLPTEVTYKVLDGATTYLFVGPLGIIFLLT